MIIYLVFFVCIYVEILKKIVYSLLIVISGFDKLVNCIISYCYLVNINRFNKMEI